MAVIELPDDVIMNILCWLPVISLIRFTAVSKRFQSIILSDPKFATSQFEAARHRKTQIILNTGVGELESIDLDMLRSAARKLSIPLEQPYRHVTLVGSCNGLVFVMFPGFSSYIWNPATQFLMELPNPAFSDGLSLYSYGAGYLSATNDYKVFVASGKNEVNYWRKTKEIKMFSSRSKVWKIIPCPDPSGLRFRGTLFNEGLHWLTVEADAIVAFDLAEEEFTIMHLPDELKLSNWQLVVSEGCLCLYRSQTMYPHSFDFWVMREYGVCDSLTMLYNFPLPESVRSLFVMDTFSIAFKRVRDDRKGQVLMKIDHKQKGEEVGMCMEGRVFYRRCFVEIPYEESDSD